MNAEPYREDEEGYAEYCAWRDDLRTKRLAKLLVECRDALPAISTVAAKIHGVDLTLADRIDQELLPWRTS